MARTPSDPTKNGKNVPDDRPDAMPDDMIQAERQQRMADWFEHNVGGSNQELARIFNASVSTIRRDLDALAARGVVRRTHGGAVRIPSVRPTSRRSTKRAAPPPRKSMRSHSKPRSGYRTTRAS